MPREGDASTTAGTHTAAETPSAVALSRSGTGQEAAAAPKELSGIRRWLPEHPELGPMPIVWFLEMKVVNPIVAVLLFATVIVFFASVPSDFASWILVISWTLLDA